MVKNLIKYNYCIWKGTIKRLLIWDLNLILGLGAYQWALGWVWPGMSGP